MDQAADLLELAASKKRITLAVDAAEATPRARADRRALGYILTNLVDNAIKYSPEGATVRLVAGPRDGGVRVSVRDTGMGIEAKHLPRLFERFYRVDPGRSRQLGGTGLGLAIVKHLGEAIGARVSVESTLGAGTTFHVDLLVFDPGATSTPAPAPAPATGAPTGSP
jgi:two-component system phosphate regulon sensor histidine kinase PhoR